MHNITYYLLIFLLLTKHNCLTKCYTVIIIAKAIRSYFNCYILQLSRNKKYISYVYINVELDCDVRTGIKIQKPCIGAPDRKQLRGLVAKWPGGGKLK